MLTIRRAQMTVFEEEFTRLFESQMLRHIAAGYPEKFSEMGEDGALGYIRTRSRPPGNMGSLPESRLAFS